MPLEVARRKADLRKVMARQRAAAAAAQPDAAHQLAHRHAALMAPCDHLGVYQAIRSEMDPMPLAKTLLSAQRAATGPVRLALPRIEGGGVMRLVAWRLGEPLTPHPFGPGEPAPGPPVVPHVVLVPLLAFTRRGHRLGYGGGYYDRWLAAHPEAIPVGVAYAGQEVDRLPVEAHDAPLAGILTEREAIVLSPFLGQAPCA